MSRPTNPLAQFRSYAYHHILVVSDTTSGAIDATTKADTDVSFDPAYPVRSSPSGSYMVLINGTQTARIYIKSLRYKVVPVSLGCCSSPTLAVEAQMTVVEPMGVRFLNILALATQELKRDASILEFGLKTIFIGHTFEGETKSITNVQPLIFEIIQIDASFDETGGTYNIKMACGSGGSGHSPATVSAGSSLKLTMFAGSTLEGAGKVMATALNQQVSDTLEKQNQDPNVDKQPKLTTIPYHYNVVIHPTLKNVKLGVNSGPERQNVGNGDRTYINDYNATPQDIIDKMIQDSDMVEGQLKVEDAVTSAAVAEAVRRSTSISAAQTKGINKRPMYNIEISQVTTKDAIEVTYTVVPYTQELTDTTVKRSPGEDPVDIEFDYIFTGRNTDIKNFDMRVQFYSNNFPGFLTGANIPNNQETTLDVGQTSIAQDGSTPVRSGTNPGDPIVGIRSAARPARNSGTRNLARPVDTMRFRNTFAQHLDQFVGDAASIEIYGNSQLLGDLTFVPGDIAGASKSPNAIAKDPLKIPTTTRINIKFPDESGNLLDFWYRGSWTIGAVENVFENGDFTQILSLVRAAATGSEAESQPSNKSIPPILRAPTRKSTGKGTGVPYTGDELDVLSRTLYGEARGEGDEGMKAVGNVIVNRAREANAPLSSVALSSYQFSCWNGATPPRDETTDRIARDILEGRVADNTDGATFYLNPRTANDFSWSRGQDNKVTTTLGQHRFYKDIAASKLQLGGARTGEGFNVPSSTASSASTAVGLRTSPPPPSTLSQAPPQMVNAGGVFVKDRINRIKAKQTT